MHVLGVVWVNSGRPLVVALLQPEPGLMEENFGFPSFDKRNILWVFGRWKERNLFLLHPFWYITKLR